MDFDSDTLDDGRTRLAVRPPLSQPAEASLRAEESGPAALSPHHVLALPAGSRLGEFEILELIGQGGFGIVYRAHDVSLQREVAIKEYLPASLAMREALGQGVAPRSESHAATFHAGLESFINEARLLAHFDHPALLKVHRFWQANGTAYMAMPLYAGPTLHSELRRHGAGMGEAQIRAWLLPLLEALEALHAARCYHRDIAPDNILLTANGPLLLDFGAARRVIGGMTRALTVVLKPGYAPIEQYGDGDMPSASQGPWTDLYALASVVRCAVTGHAPMPAVERILADRLRPLSGFAGDLYSEAFLRAIDSALRVRPQDRPQCVADFRALLETALQPAVTSVDLELVMDLPAVAPTSAPESECPATSQFSEQTGLARPAAPISKDEAPPALDRPAHARKNVAVAALLGVSAVLTWAWSLGAHTTPSVRATAPPASAATAPDTTERREAVKDPSVQPGSAAASAPASAAKAIAPPPPLGLAHAKPTTVPATLPTRRIRSVAPPRASLPQARGEPAGDEGRCADVLLRASLGNSLPEDTALIRRHCQ